MKGKLQYSPLTEKVYYVDGKGKSHDVHQNFLQMMLLFLMEGVEIKEQGAGFEKCLTSDGEIHWTIRIYKGTPKD